MSRNMNRRPSRAAKAATGSIKTSRYGNGTFSASDLIAVLALQNSVVLVCMLLVVAR